jgi:hypothetical protein
VEERVWKLVGNSADSDRRNQMYHVMEKREHPSVIEIDSIGRPLRK